MFESLPEVLAWTQNIGKQHGIIVVTVCYDTANEKWGRKDKLIMDYERGENYKERIHLKAVNPQKAFIVWKWNVHLGWDIRWVVMVGKWWLGLSCTIINSLRI